MKPPYHIIDMNLQGFTVPLSISQKNPSQADINAYRVAMDNWNKDKNKSDDNKPEAPKPVICTNAQVCHDILKASLEMAVPQGSPDVLRRLQKLQKSISAGVDNKGQLMLSVEDYRYLQSKFAKADKWNTTEDVCKTVIAVQDTISRAVIVTMKK